MAPHMIYIYTHYPPLWCSTYLCQEIAAVSCAALPPLLIFTPSQTLQQPAMEQNVHQYENQYNVSGFASLHIIDSVLSMMWHR